MYYGRDEQDWDDLVEAGFAFLVERARLGKLTSYTELNAALARRTGHREFDFSRDSDRAAMGQLLGDIVERDQPATSMITALVTYLGANDAGPGFYMLAQKKGFLSSDASKAAKWEFWVGQVSEVHRRFARTGDRRDGSKA